MKAADQKSSFASDMPTKIPGAATLELMNMSINLPVVYWSCFTEQLQEQRVNTSASY
ncbi:hypothetical protein Mapa_011958 [Marchantia paleacea]|nr:hypothetical protein Mapa_011958 [Marchantia paleacea]